MVCGPIVIFINIIDKHRLKSGVPGRCSTTADRIISWHVRASCRVWSYQDAVLAGWIPRFPKVPIGKGC